ncbi:2OG-Fe(II) oxygenase [Caldovatus aquaticus]|uniref:2OG-Fe(II) oxygenase n=1 Tax=Caldovatus aquaticus TaxID=2865671 RepID=A0ABS7F8P9_9PROT|nr:2OG-Fe(II) oxygenase [Caldovatus aquaticus]MBW8271206.1 2OG-Fe(II) oxygenase [Caldovatus aquaticus]
MCEGPASAAPEDAIAARVAALPWARVAEELDAQGVAPLGRLLAPPECAALIALYADEPRFRRRVVMARHGFGRGEYRYFAHPLPLLVAALRRALYAPLAPIASRWEGTDYPATLDAFTARCRAAGQTQPTPLLLRYGPGDYNCLHQDLYGAIAFPLQVVVLLSAPGRDFSGGAFVLTEQRPRMQSRVEVVPLAEGEAAVFAVNRRPVRGTRGTYRVTVRHGVSRVRAGERYTLGVIFHDAP